MTRKAISAGDFKQAIEFLTKARTYPENLGEGKLNGTQKNELFYWLGVAYDGMREREKANSYWHESAKGPSRVSAAMFYNAQQPDTIFIRG